MSENKRIYDIEEVSYVTHMRHITYFRVRYSKDVGRTWYGECNFHTRPQCVSYLFGLAERGRMQVESFDPGMVIFKDGKWTYTVVINGLEQRPGSATNHARAGAAKTAMRADCELARLQHGLQPVAMEA